MPYNGKELSLEDVPEQTVETCVAIELAAIADLFAAGTADSDLYRTYLLKQIADIYDPVQACHPSWKAFFERCLGGDTRSPARLLPFPKAVLDDIEKEAELPRVGKALTAHLQATRGMTDKQMSSIWYGPQYHEHMRYLQRVSMALKVFCTYHKENNPDKFQQPVPDGWFARRSA